MIDVIGARDRRAGQIVRKPAQLMRGIGHMRGDHMHHVVIIFDASAHLHQPCAHHHLAVSVLQVRPDDDVRHPRLILQRHEDNRP